MSFSCFLDYRPWYLNIFPFLKTKEQAQYDAGIIYARNMLGQYQGTPEPGRFQHMRAEKIQSIILKGAALFALIVAIIVVVLVII